MADELISDPAGGDHNHSAAYAPYAQGRLLPAGAISDTFNRISTPIGPISALTSGTISAVAIMLPAGALVSTISFVCRSNAAVAPTNQWFGLFDSSRSKLAVTADDLTAAWVGSQVKTLTLSSAFTTTYSGLHYLGCLVVAGTVPSLAGQSTTTGLLTALAPALQGNADAGLTTPATCPATLTTLTGVGVVPYAYCS